MLLTKTTLVKKGKVVTRPKPLLIRKAEDFKNGHISFEPSQAEKEEKKRKKAEEKKRKKYKMERLKELKRLSQNK